MNDMEPSSKRSLRPSSSNPSLKPISNRPPSTRSTGSGVRPYRYGLLRPNFSREHSVEKESPVPPVLTTQETSELIGRDITQKPKHRRISIPTRKSSKADLMPQYQQTLPISESPQPSRVCIDPAMHPPGTHAKVHHPGLVTGADYCDAGLPVERESPIRSPPSTTSYASLASTTLTGQVHHLLTCGDPLEELVDVSDHIHGDHSSIVKDPEHHYFPNDAHEGHTWIDKAQPYHESSALLAETEQNSIPRVVVHKQSEQPSQKSESSKETAYWGFLPKLGDKRNDSSHSAVNVESHSPPYLEHLESIKAQTRSQDQSIPIPPTEPRSSFSASQYSASQGSSNLVSKAVAKLAGNESMVELGTPMVNSNRAKKTSSKYESDQSKQHSVPGKIDPGRTITWLRELLGYPESSGPKFTKLPEKSHPRHQDHEDYPKRERGSIPSRVTTFSGENAADADVMDAAMQNLEELLNEALYLANEVPEKDYCGHVNDGNLPPRFQDTSDEVHRSSEPLSVRESLQSDSNDTVHELILTGTPPNIHVGVVEGLVHGCEALPLRSVKRLGLGKPDMRNGNIRGPNLPDRKSSAWSRLSSRRGLRKAVRESTGGDTIRHHPLDDDCVLPMPKRQHADNKDNSTETIDRHTKDVPNRREVRDYIRTFHQPPIGPRNSSRNLLEDATAQRIYDQSRRDTQVTGIRRRDVDVCSFDGSTSDNVIDFSTQYNANDTQRRGNSGVGASSRSNNHNLSAGNTGSSQRRAAPRRTHELRNISLRRRSHVSIRDGQKFSLTKSVKRQPPIARDWSPSRKRLVASVACLSTALIGVLVGIYAGLVPSIQYYITDLHHYAIIGNVALYLGMALSTFFCWPLSLLHGRKTYIVCSLCLAMPLLFPQAIAVSVPRSPYTSVWRWALLFPRGLMGCALGFANVNFHSILTDLFGASLMSTSPHQEVVDHCDVRRHGSGLGVWLGIWTWCFIGSLGVGFLVGALVIDSLEPSWGLYISIICIGVVLVLNVLCPEVRRSAWRRSVAEVRIGSSMSRRVAREVYHGAALSLEMLRQPGFAIMAVYSAWIYSQAVLIIVLLGALSSRHYRFRPPLVGACVSSVALGALTAVPFQKANLFSRSRSTGPVTNSMTFDRKVTWTSHLVRRATFVLLLPIVGVLYTRTNYSSFPRVTAGWNVIHSIGFVFAAGATGIGGMVTRNLGQRAATGIAAGILLILTLGLLGVLARFRRIQIIPNSKSMEMDRWTDERRDSLRRRVTAIADAKAAGKDVSEVPEDDFRRMNILELGSLTRWSEIRKKNRLIDEGVRLNKQTVYMARDEIGRRADEFIDDIHNSAERFTDLVRKVSKRSLRSKRSHDSDKDNHSQVEREDVGPLGPPGAGLEHQHTQLPRNVYYERECVMGQTVPEETEEVSSVDGGSDDDYSRNRAPDHASHMTPKVQPYLGFERQETHGGSGDYVIDMDASRREHAFHMQPKVRPADPDGSEHREQHGAHMQNKVKSADRDRIDL
ncbi:hypothetical protein F5B20DRAFT_569861 [Whalleya microplaca]|nr:hypothetical protein F5B20DRAFT_569861 [Whalleya microplaca]